MIRIIICDDQAIVREGLKTIISTDPEISVIGTAADGEELLHMLRSMSSEEIPHLVLLDLKMPVLNGIRAAQEINSRYPSVKILVLTTYDEDAWVFDAIRAGASGYILKDTPKESLFDAIKGTVMGSTYVDPSLAGKVLKMVRGEYVPQDTEALESFSEREREMIILIARGYSNTEIGEKLFLSAGTVRNYTSSIFTKLNVADRTQATVAALRNGLIRLEDI